MTSPAKPRNYWTLIALCLGGGSLLCALACIFSIVSAGLTPIFSLIGAWRGKRQEAAVAGLAAGLGGLSCLTLGDRAGGAGGDGVIIALFIWVISIFLPFFIQIPDCWYDASCGASLFLNWI